MKQTSYTVSQTISDESVTCIAVKEDRHQIIMAVWFLTKASKNPWTSMES